MILDRSRSNDFSRAFGAESHDRARAPARRRCERSSRTSNRGSRRRRSSSRRARPRRAARAPRDRRRAVVLVVALVDGELDRGRARRRLRRGRLRGRRARSETRETIGARGVRSDRRPRSIDRPPAKGRRDGCGDPARVAVARAERASARRGGRRRRRRRRAAMRRDGDGGRGRHRDDRGRCHRRREPSAGERGRVPIWRAEACAKCQCMSRRISRSFTTLEYVLICD